MECGVIIVFTDCYSGLCLRSGEVLSEDAEGADGCQTEQQQQQGSPKQDSKQISVWLSVHSQLSVTVETKFNHLQSEYFPPSIVFYVLCKIVLKICFIIVLKVRNHNNL